MTPEHPDALVVGAGPAGLMAAEQLARAGRRVVVAEAMPAPARKLLMAGKSGLNLTRDEPAEVFARHILAATGDEAGGCRPPDPSRYLRTDEGAGPDFVRAWAGGLGQALVTGSTGRVFPAAWKASPLLRAWLARLDGLGVGLRTRWRWTGFDGGALVFATAGGVVRVAPCVTVLALGGASWPRLGSDAAWVPWLEGVGVRVAPFRPANMGFRVAWTPAMTPFLGAPVKGVAIRAGAAESRGEWVLTPAGIEGGGVYTVAAALRDGAAGHVDLAPDLTAATLAARLGGRASIGNRLRRALASPVHVALALEWGRPLPADPTPLAVRLKALPLRHAGPMGLDRAISSAGGVAWDSVAPDLSLRVRPDLFVAGEMLDWEAPTGGYLLTWCLTSGWHAGRNAARHG